jgi:hypothetical protein
MVRLTKTHISPHGKHYASPSVPVERLQANDMQIARLSHKLYDILQLVAAGRASAADWQQAPSLIHELRTLDAHHPLLSHRACRYFDSSVAKKSLPVQPVLMTADDSHMTFKFDAFTAVLLAAMLMGLMMLMVGVQ